MILNLTPHPIRLYADDRPDGLDDLDLGLRRVIDPQPTPARLGMVPLTSEYRDGIPVELVEPPTPKTCPAAKTASATSCPCPSPSASP